MDFFSRQDQARRRTMILALYFTCAVILIVTAINLLAVGIANVVSAYGQTNAQPELGQPAYSTGLWRWDVIAYATIATLGVIIGGTLFKMAMLGRGGRSVAEMMGALPVLPNTTDLKQKMLRDVVEEMSIASGVPVPAIYVLARERGINAFAAGLTPRDAVVCVTQGALDRLSRDELQGVIAHEFSHILNGDVRLDLKLVGLLYGILLIGLIGYGLLRGSASSNSDDRDFRAALAMMAIGAILMGIGFVGLFFGRLIQAAVCRQREFLADASAVQFTRNPNGLCGALKKIGAGSSESRVSDHDAEQIAHMFFASSAGVGQGWFATHPPLPVRIRTLDASWDGKFVIAGEPIEQSVYTTRRADRATLPRGIPVAAAAVAASVGAPRPTHIQWASDFLAAVPPVLDHAARDPFSARALIFAMLLSDEASVRSKQQDALRSSTDAPTLQLVAQLAQPVAQYGPRGRRVLTDLALPALRHLSGPQCQQFAGAVQAMIDADSRVNLFEYMLHKIIEKYLTGPAAGAKPPQVAYWAFKPLLGDIQVVLSALARADQKPEVAVQEAFAAGAARLGDDARTLSLQTVDLKQVDQALEKLAQAIPGIKRRVVDACAFCVAADGMVQTEEGELLRAIMVSLDCPLPPMLGK